MPSDPSSAPVETAVYVAGGPGAPPDQDQELADLGWWLSGGMSLLAWTAIALLLTSA
jgi:hypothetical protein